MHHTCGITVEFREKKFFAKTSAKFMVSAKKCSRKSHDNCPKNENFRETEFREISQKLSHFLIIFALKNAFSFQPKLVAILKWPPNFPNMSRGNIRGKVPVCFRGITLIP
jgi:hypothetical protein